MGIMNLGLWNKAYMLEFIYKKNPNSTETKVFTFSVPPESEDFDFGQRISETKTFGGSVFDDYGNDSIKINLSGSTVNEEKKLIYRGNKTTPDYYTGEKEIFALQEIINESGQIEKLPNKKVYLYDLSKMSMIQIVAGSPVRNYWRVFIKDLKIKRAKDKPRTFNYTLEMIGVDEKREKLDPLFGDGVADFLDNVQKVVDTIQNVLGYVEFAAAALDSVAAGVVSTKKAFEKLAKADWTSPESVLKNIGSLVDSSLRIIGGGSNNSVFNTAQDLVAATHKVAGVFGAYEDDDQQSATASQDDKFAVSFDTNGGSYIAPVTVSYGNTVSAPTPPTRTKYAFAGWYSDSDLTDPYDFATEIAKNIRLYAKWTQTLATVTFNSRQGSPVAAQTVNIGEKATTPDSPTRNSYVFEYWCTDSAATDRYNFETVVSGDIILYARWKTIYTITFNSVGGSPVESQSVNVGEKVIYPTIPNRENYLFVYWCTDPAFNTEYDFSSAVNSSFILYAKWTQVTNIVSFESNGGSPIASQSIRIGHYATKPPDPAREGYTFARWCSDPGLTNEFIFDTTVVNTPMTLYASWNINVYTVSFNDNGGPDVPPQSVNYQEKAIYPPTPEMPGYLFRRWCTDEGLETEFDFSIPITEDLILYADWFGD
jgi:uncharacterized repeat protein (TIGR02543 family)